MALTCTSLKAILLQISSDSRIMITGGCNNQINPETAGNEPGRELKKIVENLLAGAPDMCCTATRFEAISQVSSSTIIRTYSIALKA
jgi:hypothetical protein